VAYGVVLTTARALGEFGAVSIVSGHLEGQTQTLTLYVQDRFEQFDLVGAYTASIVLAVMALAVLGLMSVVGAGGLRMAIDIHRVCKRYGTFTALDDVSLTIPGGSLTALLGPSGSGKSTLLRVIAGLETADSGEVFILGDRATRVPPQKRNIGFVFQHYAAFKHMTVWENVAFGLKVRKRPRAEIRARVDELLALVQLEGFTDRYPGQLSGGQRQRMALARALAVDPRVLLLDEPFGALDAQVRRDLRAWLRRLHDEVQVTTVLVTHDQEEAMEVADTIVVLNHGRVEQIGTPRELFERPDSPFVMSFIGAANRIGDLFIRPRDVLIRPGYRNSTHEAQIERLVYLGFEVRADLILDDGHSLQAMLNHDEAEMLELQRGQIVGVDLSRGRRFPGPDDVAAAMSA
jgi:sulfate transport system ATP-binding protein